MTSVIQLAPQVEIPAFAGMTAESVTPVNTGVSKENATVCFSQNDY